MGESTVILLKIKAELRSQVTTLRDQILIRGAIASFVALGTGCGKYAAPEPPERLSPAAVEVGEVIATGSGVTIQWLAPTEDQRGKRLNALLGYIVYRKELATAADTLDPLKPFDEIKRVDDSSLARLKKKTEEAVQSGKPARQISLASQERRVSVTDETATPGRTYLYKIAPFSSDGIDGGVESLIRVVFTGASGSSVTVIPAAKTGAIESNSINGEDDLSSAGGLW